jgi:hypothetical protein
MIVVTYLADLSSDSSLVTQLSRMAFTPLQNQESLLTGLELVSDVTSWTGSNLQRVLTFRETPESDARLGLPLTDEKRRGLVTGLYNRVIGAKILKPITERIDLSNRNQS